MELTKTDFLQFLNCPKSLWLLKKDPEKYVPGEFSKFRIKLIKEGYEIEHYAKQLFTELSSEGNINFQKAFITADNLFAKADIFITSRDGRNALYEVKSSTSIKTDKHYNHIKDACFQKICAERSGTKIDSIHIVHLNSEYVRCGDIDPQKMLTIVDITLAVKAIESETAAEIDQALLLLAQEEIDRSYCSCLEKSRSHHCDSFKYFNPKIPELSIYCLPRLTDKKRRELLDNNQIALKDVSDDFLLSPQQEAVLQSAKLGQPLINHEKICTFFNKLVYPLYFFDFETYSSAIPIIDGISPHKPLQVQYSLHVLNSNGNLTHKEYLADQAMLPEKLILEMMQDIGNIGSILSWHAQFEKTQNKEMAILYPQYADFLHNINERMVDLEDIFKIDYVDANFYGSTSIKKVLPVFCAHLSYKDMDVQDGTAAMEAWFAMISNNCPIWKKNELSIHLKEYCKMDTLAMVEIFKTLKEIALH